MNRQEPQSSPQSLEEESKTTSGATVLFSRKDIVPAGDSGTKAASETAEPASAVRAPEERTTVAASVMPTQRADLTGIFRKVQLEHPENGNEQTELISSQPAEGQPAGKDNRKNSEQEYTQVFQTLSAAKEKGDNAARTDGKPDVQTGATQYGGDFTQLLRTLSAEAEAEIPAAPAPLPPQPASGPGEFTRIISGAMLREAQGRIGASERTDAQKAAAAVNAAPAKPAAAPPQKQPVPHAQPPVAAAAKTPPAAAAPQAPQDSAPAQGKLQQYMPLLLIANFFLMLIVLALLAFVFLHRYKP